MKFISFIFISAIVIVAFVSARPADNNASTGGQKTTTRTSSGTGSETDSGTANGSGNGHNQGNSQNQGDAQNSHQGSNNDRNNNIGGNRNQFRKLLRLHFQTMHQMCLLIKQSLFPGLFPSPSRSNKNNSLPSDGLLDNGLNSDLSEDTDIDE